MDASVASAFFTPEKIPPWIPAGSGHAPPVPSWRSAFAIHGRECHGVHVGGGMAEDSVPEFEQRNADLAPARAPARRRGVRKPVGELRQCIVVQVLPVQPAAAVFTSEVGDRHTSAQTTASHRSLSTLTHPPGIRRVLYPNRNLTLTLDLPTGARLRKRLRLRLRSHDSRSPRCSIFSFPSQLKAPYWARHPNAATP